MDYFQEARKLEATVIQHRRHFHSNPETSGEEFLTADYIANYLKKLGLVVARGFGNPYPGVVGLLRGSGGGRTVALRADMDALSIEEKNEAPYCSRKKGVMHACGHDGHMAILLGAAELLASNRTLLNGNVKFIFQPAEEFRGGAAPMISDGVLKNPDVDAIFGLHLDPDYQTGEVAFSYGETLAASDRLIIKIKGRSGHGATPHLAVDALVVTAHVLLGLQSLISREKDPLSPAVLSFGVIQGGQQPNAIVDEVVLKGILRTLNQEVREFIIENIERIVAGITRSFHAGYEFIREKSYDNLVNHNQMVDFAKQTVQPIVGEQGVKQLPKPRMIVEDFAYYLQKVPGAYYFLGCRRPGQQTAPPLHSSHFDIDEDALTLGVALQAGLAADYLSGKG